MMCMQSPGSFLFAYSLAVRPGTNWSSWITYLCTGILQAVLLGMCIVWRLREKREDRKGKGIARDVDETTALLDDHQDWFVSLFCMALGGFAMGVYLFIIRLIHSVMITDLNISWHKAGTYTIVIYRSWDISCHTLWHSNHPELGAVEQRWS